MRRLLLLACAVLLLGMPNGSLPTGVDLKEAVSVRPLVAPAAPAPFRLPADEAGALLGQALTPTPTPGSLHNPTHPPPPALPPPPFVAPNVELPALALDLPQLPKGGKESVVRPELVQEEGLGNAFLPPPAPVFATGKRMRVASPDATLPPPLPVLARPTPNRAPLTDATAEAARTLILSAPPALKPAPYQRVALPRPTLPPPEEPTAPVVPPLVGRWPHP